jgi:HKD family nuclease
MSSYRTPHKSFTKKIVYLFLLLCVVVTFYHSNKALPDDISYTGTVHEVASSDVHIFTDKTFLDEDGFRQSEQEIFDEILRMIRDSSEYVLLDMFLFNDLLGAATTSYRGITEELTSTLITKKEQNPDMVMQVTTDPLNIIYGGYVAPHLEKLEAADISVIMTDLTPLHDSNPLYSAPWRILGQWWGNSTAPGYLPNPFSTTAQKLSVRSYLHLLNFKANHRKVVLADYNRAGEYGLATLITSANPHDGSSAHSNVAVRVDTKVWADVLVTEAAVAAMSGREFILPTRKVMRGLDAIAGEDLLQVQLLTEGAIETGLLSLITSLGSDDTLDMSMFYIADRDVVSALKAADDRGVQIRLMFDPNKDAFGREKGGLPNRQVAYELMQHSTGNTQVRWCATHGEQCHSKLLLLQRGNETILFTGSANLTKRNIGDYNLETNIVISGASTEPTFITTRSFFEEQWNNENDRLYTFPYEQYSDDSLRKTIQYRVMEWTGLSSW